MYNNIGTQGIIMLVGQRGGGGGRAVGALEMGRGRGRGRGS